MSMLFVSYKISSLTLIIAGFCESSLGHVERLNVEKMEWEDLPQVKIARTKFSCVQGINPYEILIIGGKD